MEVERLRRKTAEESRRAASQDVDEVEVVGPAPAPPPRPRPAPRPRPRRVEPQVLEVLPASPPQAAPAPNPAPTPSPYDQPKQEVSTPKQDRVARTAVVGAVQAAGQGGKVVAQVSLDVVTLLRSKQIQSAMILSEILGPPVSLRRRRG